MREVIYIYYCYFDKGVSSETLTRTGLERYLTETERYPEAKKETEKQKCPETKREPGTEGQDPGPEIQRLTPRGKPFFTAYPEICHNVSHSGEWWVCAYGRRNVGLDLQKNEHKDTRKIAERFFHPLEKKWLADKDPRQFYRIWAFKESYLKYTGDGLTKGLDHFSVISPDKDKTDPGVVDVWQCEITFPEKGYWLVLTTDRPADVVLRKLDVDFN